MASLVGAVTLLTLSGVSGPVTFTYEAPPTFARPGGLEFTQLGTSAVSAKRYGTFFGKSELLNITVSVSDTAFLSGTETPQDLQEIVSYDIASLSVSESTQLSNRIGATDTATLSLSEVVTLTVTGVASITPTDTASVSVSESVAIAATLDVTDTTSLTLTESATKVDAGESFAVTDDASIAVNDFASVNIFTGVLDLAVVDDIVIASTETATAEDARVVSKIAFQARVPKITFRRI